MLCRTCFVTSHQELNESISMTHILAKSIGKFMRYCLVYIFAIFNDILHMSFLAGTQFSKRIRLTLPLSYESAQNVVRFVRFQ